MATIATQVPTQTRLVSKALLAIVAALLVVGLAVGLLVAFDDDDTSPAVGAAPATTSTQTLTPAEEIGMFTDASSPTASELSVPGEVTAITGVR